MPTLRTEIEALATSNVLGVPVHRVILEQVLELCSQAARARERFSIGVVNAAKLVKMRSDPLLRRSVLGSDLILADGMSVVWASRILGEPLPERVPGIGLFEALLGVAEKQGFSVYFLGATQPVLEAVLARARTLHPGLRVAGSRNGYFSEAEQAAVAGAIDAAAPDLLFVAMSTPAKEIFLDRFGRDMNVAVCHGVGGSFDVFAGRTARAPERWQRAGMEWLFRVLQEPRRMWKRYLVTNSIFLALLAKAWLQQRIGRRARGAA